MSTDIRPGDLVYMAHRVCDCAKCREPMNIPFVVSAIVGDTSITIHCGTDWSRVIGFGPVAHGLGTFNIPLGALKKIEPGIVEDDVTTREEMPA